MPKVRSFFDNPIFKGVLQTVIAVGLIGIFSAVWTMRENDIKQNETLNHINENFERLRITLEQHSIDITTLKVDVGGIKAANAAKNK